jgi:large subunit ribosomal protein L21
MYAVIVTGGKQYRVKAGDLLAIEKLGVEPGRKVHFDRVLLIEDGENVQIGRPVLENAVVEAEVVENFKDEKVLVFKKKRRKQYRRTRGHRQQLTKVRIDRVLPDKSVLPAVHLVEDKPEPAGTAAPAKAPVKAIRPKKGTPTKTAPKPKATKPAASPKTKKATKKATKE